MSLIPSTSTSPPPERSLNRQAVLEEDEYTEALSKIIARDFFPSLAHLDATNEHLDALQSGDPALIHASVRKLHGLAETPHRASLSDTPFYGGRGASETPLRTPRGDGPPPSKRPRYDWNLSLDEFQARYTSEDNSSFTQILDDENKKRRERWSWAWDAQRRVEEQSKKLIEKRERMLIEGPVNVGVREKFVIEAPRPAGLITEAGEDPKEESEEDTTEADKGKELAKVTAVDDDNEPVDVLAPKKDTRSAAVDGWKFKTRNSLMFAPDADASPYQGPTSFNAPTGKDPRFIKHNNTRLVDDSDSLTRSQSVPPSPTQSHIDAAIAGKPYRPRSPKGFSLVPNIPSPTPSELGPAGVKQLMTWGTLGATPRIISQSDDPAPSQTPNTPFRLQEISSREAISHRLSNKASKSLREKAGLLAPGSTPGIHRTPGPNAKGSMGPPTWTPRRADAAGSLTPAARRLLDRSTMGTAAARRADVMGMRWANNSKSQKDLNKVRWTPTPNQSTRGG